MTAGGPALVLGVSAAAGAATGAWRPVPALRRVAAGVAAGAGIAAAVFAPDLALVGLVVLVLAALQAAALPAARPLRAPVLAAGLLAVGGIAAASPGGGPAQRLAAIAIALAVAGLAGVVPHLAEGGDADLPLSSLAWTAVLAPALCLVVIVRAQAELAGDADRLLGGLLLSLGCINVVWGLGRSFDPDAGRAWRHSFAADWGLALVALGLLGPAGFAAALLLLVAMMLARLPAAAAAETATPEAAAPARWRLLWTLALAGAVPFAGFPARVLLLRAATLSAWPLALALAVALTVWLPASWRLAGSLPLPRGRRLVALLAMLALSVAAGVYPFLALRPAGFG